MIDEAPVPYRRTRKIRLDMSAHGKAVAGYVTFFVAALSMFGAMILLSLL